MTVTITDLPDISRSYKNAAEAIAFAIDHMELALSKTRYSFNKPSKAYYEMRRCIPYFIERIKIANTYILVNRCYKPLGSNQPSGGVQAIYEEFTNLHVSLTTEQINSVTAPRSSSNGYLFDKTSPWSGRKAGEAYLARLQRLHSLLSTKR